jgi:phage shock protein PspC (stress-responsive transcriptional regulator)
MFAGVCRGLSVYFDLDVTLVRLLFVVISALSAGVGLVAYFVMAFSVPLADTSEEKAAAMGGTPTAKDFIRRAKEGYYEAMKDFPDKEQRRAWKKRFKRDMHAWSENFKNQIQGNAAQWGHNWQSHWGPPSQPHPVAWIAMPVLSILSAVLWICGVGVILSILKTGGIFGLVLPAALPIWLSIVIVIALCQLIEWPLKVARFSIWAPGGRGHYYPRGNGLIWLAIFCCIAWFVYPHQTQEFIHNLPPFMHRAFDSISAWWNQK